MEQASVCQRLFPRCTSPSGDVHSDTLNTMLFWEPNGPGLVSKMSKQMEDSGPSMRASGAGLQGGHKNTDPKLGPGG